MQMIIFLISAVAMGIIAWKKGFKPWLWILAGGVPGLIILAFIPSAKVDGLDEAVRERRRRAGNLVGALFSSFAVVFSITVVILVFTVKDIQSLLDLVYPFIGRFPWVFACMVGFAVIIVYWHKSPKASSWALKGVGLVVISQLVGAGVTPFMSYAMEHYVMTKTQMGIMNGVITIVLTLLNILAFSFLMAGVYADRNNESEPRHRQPPC